MLSCLSVQFDCLFVVLFHASTMFVRGTSIELHQRGGCTLVIYRAYARQVGHLRVLETIAVHAPHLVGPQAKHCGLAGLPSHASSSLPEQIGQCLIPSASASAPTPLAAAPPLPPPPSLPSRSASALPSLHPYSGGKITSCNALYALSSNNFVPHASPLLLPRYRVGLGCRFCLIPQLGLALILNPTAQYGTHTSWSRRKRSIPPNMIFSAYLRKLRWTRSSTSGDSGEGGLLRIARGCGAREEPIG